MTSGVDFTVRGLPELTRALEGLPRYIQSEVLADAIRPAGEMVRSAVAANVPSGPYSRGNLQRSIVFRATQISGVPSGVVQPNRRRGAPIGRHAHLVERGVNPHAATYYGHPYMHPGMPARPFFFPAVESVHDAALDTMFSVIEMKVEAYWAAQSGVY